MVSALIPLCALASLYEYFPFSFDTTPLRKRCRPFRGF